MIMMTTTTMPTRKIEGKTLSKDPVLALGEYDGEGNDGGGRAVNLNLRKTVWMKIMYKSKFCHNQRQQ